MFGTYLLPYLVSRASLLKYARCSCCRANTASRRAVKVLKQDGTSSIGEPPPGKTHISLAPYTAWHSHALISVSSLDMFVNTKEWIRWRSRSGSSTIRRPASIPGDTSLHPGAISDTVRQLKSKKLWKWKYFFLYTCMQNPRLRTVYRQRKWLFLARVRKIMALGRKKMALGCKITALGWIVF